MAEKLLLGVDGGGTKTAAWLGLASARDSHAPPQVVGKGEAGPSNPRAIGFEAALCNVAQAIQSAFDSMATIPAPVAKACLCLAGVARPSEKERVQEWLQGQGVAQHFRLAMDVEAILASVPVTPGHATSATDTGIALIAGTGSIAWGSHGPAVTARCGGWGFLLGDQGSGYAIALAGLRAACLAADGQAEMTPLLPAMLEELQLSQASQLIEWIYDSHTTRDQIARLCHQVFELYNSDVTARAIVDQAAVELADMAETTAEKLQLQDHGYPLALAGGVFFHQPHFRELVSTALATTPRRPNRIHLVAEPVLGALHLAQQMHAHSSE